MKILRFLLGKRRWLLWPFPLFALCSGDTLSQSLGMMLITPVVLAPYYLAWWLSDGFTDIEWAEQATCDYDVHRSIRYIHSEGGVSNSPLP